MNGKKVRLTESRLRRVVAEAVSRTLDEVRYIDTSHANKDPKRDSDEQEPIRDGDRIRVFHGCDLKDAVTFARHGLSGKAWASRKYSYEAGMNPIGLFVSTSFETAKEFANPFGGPKDTSKTAAVIIEFTAKASDLDTPVWNGSASYFGQGSNPQPFRDRAERDAQKRRYNDTARGEGPDWVRDSDNPAMAWNVFGNREHQALFIGDLDPNMIRRFWVKRYADGSGRGPTDQRYAPMKRAEFLREFGNEEFYVDGTDNQYSQVRHSRRLFRPSEDFTSLEDMADRRVRYDLEHRGKWLGKYIGEHFGGDFNAWRRHELEMLVDGYKQCVESGDADVLGQYLWPRQLYQLLGKEGYGRNFDRFGIGFPS